LQTRNATGQVAAPIYTDVDIGPAPSAAAMTVKMACHVWERRLQLLAAALCRVGERVRTRSVAGGGAAPPSTQHRRRWRRVTLPAEMGVIPLLIRAHLKHRAPHDLLMLRLLLVVQLLVIALDAY
jgi:hypothetical protein